MVEHYTTILPFKPKKWVLCNCPMTLKDVILLMEVYASIEARMYLIPKAWRKKAETLPGETGHSPPARAATQKGGEWQGPLNAKTPWQDTPYHHTSLG